MKSKASLIISVYKNITFLKTILASLAFQTEKSFDLIISEDGEDSSMKEFINSYSFEFDCQHLTQPDEGWRKEKALNKAIQAAKSDYLVFIDGDCVLHPRFMEFHIQMGDDSSILAGKRVKLNPELSNLLINNPSEIKNMQSHLAKTLFNRKGVRYIEEGFFIAPNSLLGFIPKIRTLNHLTGSNMSFSRKAIETINGFDEDYILPAVGEDGDLTWRFEAAGYKHRSVRNLAVQYHLYHKEIWNDQTKNMAIMTEKRSRNEFVCKNGIKKYQ